MTVRTNAVTNTSTISVSCNSGEKAVGGGGTSSNLSNRDVSESLPLNGASPAVSGDTPDGWRFSINGGNANLTAYVLCAS
ncbi:MAG: hypothetical protein WDZ37_03535 [Solirubrobacterales bacterium]